MSGSSAEGRHAEVYVRSLAPRGVGVCQSEVIESLRELRDGGILAEYTVLVCGAHAPAQTADTDTDFGAYLLERVATFEEWADRNGFSLGSLFERRTVESSLTGESHERLDLPAIVLAEYEGPDLRFVAPCTTEERHWTVRERLDSLARGEEAPGIPLPDVAAEPTASTPARRNRARRP